MTRNGTVFIVDDDLSVRRSLRRLVISVGYNVQLFSSAEEVLAVTDWPKACCLIVDVSMPGMTGVELVDALRAASRNVPVILSSGYSDAATLARARQSDVFAFLPKPFRAHELLPLLARMCEPAAVPGSASPHLSPSDQA
ncbi:MAG TPA: response regulator [Vicinamibacterales bacterium]|nr:response regulator [Vicinamibacterales bacterium]